MNSSNLVLIVFAELVVLLLVICAVLVVQNRSLRKLVSQLKEKAQGILKELKQAKQANLSAASSAETPETDPAPGVSYLDYLEQQIEVTREYHAELNSGQDIALDLAPESPLIHRAPALRHAVLLAEKNALAKIQNHEAPDWKELGKSYETIFNFYEEFTEAAEASESVSAEELEQLQVELDNARKRVNNLEKFKKLYFDLEEKWHSSQKEAKSHLDNLTSMTAEIENGDALQEALQNYHQSYDGFSDLLEAGVDGTQQQPEGSEGSEGSRSEALDSAAEIKKLRAVAADQHKIISKLQQQLLNAKTEDERHNVVVNLQSELQKQTRFVKESETCIQLLEDELQAAQREIDASKSKLAQLPEIKSDYIDLRNQYEELELKYHANITENRKLQKKLQAAGSVKENAAEEAKLRKQLAEISSKYNELEEKFLDLKMQH